MAQIEIDIELTDCVVHIATGTKYKTLVRRVTAKDIANLDGFEFDWASEFKDKSKEVYKLTVVGKPNEIQGLISLADNKRNGVVDVFLAERKDYYRGKKEYLGVGGNLFAFACRKSKEYGHSGYVLFEAKTKLIGYYEKELGATQLGRSNFMGIKEEVAKPLIKRYYKGA